MLRITASQVHADLTGVHPVAGNVEPKQNSIVGGVKFSIPTYLLGSVRDSDGCTTQADGEHDWVGAHHETPLQLTMAAAHLRAMCLNLLSQLDALEGRREPIVQDPVEDLRQALVNGDVERARTLIGGVWHEREGLRRRERRLTDLSGV